MSRLIIGLLASVPTIVAANAAQILVVGARESANPYINGGCISQSCLSNSAGGSEYDTLLFFAETRERALWNGTAESGETSPIAAAAVDDSPQSSMVDTDLPFSIHDLADTQGANPDQLQWVSAEHNNRIFNGNTASPVAQGGPGLSKSADAMNCEISPAECANGNGGASALASDPLTLDYAGASGNSATDPNPSLEGAAAGETAISAGLSERSAVSVPELSTGAILFAGIGILGLMLYAREHVSSATARPSLAGSTPQI